MARPRIPLALRLVAGTVRPSTNVDEPVVEKDLRAAPPWMTPAQKRIWDEHITDCPAGMLKGPDGGTLGNYCVAHAERDDLVLKLRKHPTRLYKTTKGNLIQHPYVGMLNRQILIMTKLASELGFTATSRARVKVPKSGKENPFADHAAKQPRQA